jgi:hypothetical protein
MKTRTGFVSNSSSTSFLVGFEKVPETAEELEKLLYGESGIVEGYRNSYTTKALASYVFDDMIRQTPLTLGQLGQAVLEEFEDRGIVSEGSDVSNYLIDNPNDPFNNVDWVAFGAARAKYIKNLVQECLGSSNYSTLIWYNFTFCDELGGVESVLEHSETFERLPHLAMNRH